MTALSIEDYEAAFNEGYEEAKESYVAELLRLRSRNAELEEALRKAIDAIDSDACKSVFAFWAVHGFNYSGPVVDVSKVRALLDDSLPTAADVRGILKDAP